nr:hypothetical protein [Tanacetum cinerariifolium]
EDLPVHFDRQLLGVFKQLGDRRREVNVDAAFIAGDAQRDADIVLARCLGVAAGGRPDVQLAGLGLIARVVLVADRDRRQVQRLNDFA